MRREGSPFHHWSGPCLHRGLMPAVPLIWSVVREPKKSRGDLKTGWTGSRGLTIQWSGRADAAGLARRVFARMHGRQGNTIPGAAAQLYG
jgi:hypothetical protein